jgi:hypothetical protein
MTTFFVLMITFYFDPHKTPAFPVDFPIGVYRTSAACERDMKVARTTGVMPNGKTPTEDFGPPSPHLSFIRYDCRPVTQRTPAE